MNKIKKFLVVLLIATGSLSAQSVKPSYMITDKIKLEGDGGWDYLVVDESAERLFVSHSSIVQVVDLSSKILVGTIPDTKGVHGIALAPNLNKGFISNGRDSSITVFNLKTLAFVKKVYVSGRNPDAILYDSFSKHVFTFNGGGDNSTVIDALTDEVIGTIKLAGKPEFAVTDEKGKVYVNIEDKSLVSVINPVTLKVISEWSINPGEEPSGLAIDINNQRLFIVCENKLMVVMDAISGKIIKTLPIGSHTDGAAFDIELKRAYSSNGDGTLTIVQEKSKDEFEVIENVITQKGARTIAINSKTHHIYLPTAEYGAMPETTKENTHPRPAILPGTFNILEVTQIEK